MSIVFNDEMGAKSESRRRTVHMVAFGTNFVASIGCRRLARLILVSGVLPWYKWYEWYYKRYKVTSYVAPSTA